MMDQEELKRKLMGLWEKTTHTSKELLSLLFDYYFDVNYVEYKEIEGKIVSALFGIPYKFGFGNNRLQGLYLISLSSEEGYRKKGILAELLTGMNEKVKDSFDFTFLVPHTELLADYFGSQGYYSSFFIIEERYTALHDFHNDYLLSLTDSDERIRELKKDLLDEIKVIDSEEEPTYSKVEVIEFIEQIEQKGSSSVNLNHSSKDIHYLLEEQNIRDLISVIAYDNDKRISGVAFICKEELKRIKVLSYYITDDCSYYALLEYIKKKYSDYSLTVVTSESKSQIHSIIQETYASSNPSGGDLDNTFGTVEIVFNINKLLQPLGMVRLLNFDNIIRYLAETRSDVEFKLQIRDNYNPEDKDKVFVVKNGRFQKEDYKSFKNDRSIIKLSRKEISELLLRKNDSNNLIMEAFGIPRLNLQFRLLPF